MSTALHAAMALALPTWAICVETVVDDGDGLTVIAAKDDHDITLGLLERLRKDLP